METDADRMLREMAEGEKKMGSGLRPLIDDDVKRIAEALARNTTLTYLK